MTQNSRDKLLLALLKNVTFDGWTDEALRKTASGKIKLADLMKAFPNGISDVLNAFGEYGERQMLAKLSKHKLIQMRVRDRVKLGVQLWLEVMIPHREALRMAALSAWQPGRAIGGMKGIAKLCDAIWYEAGDQSTDYNRYTKRALLGLVFTSTMIFWLQDESENFERTAEFLDARIENAMQLGKVTGSLKNLGNLFDKAKDLSAVADILPRRKKAA